MADSQSPLVEKVLSVNPRAYGALVVEGGTPALARELLDGVQPGKLHASPIGSFSRQLYEIEESAVFL